MDVSSYHVSRCFGGFVVSRGYEWQLYLERPLHVADSSIHSMAVPWCICMPGLLVALIGLKKKGTKLTLLLCSAPTYTVHIHIPELIKLPNLNWWSSEEWYVSILYFESYLHLLPSKSFLFWPLIAFELSQKSVTRWQ